MLHLTNAPNSSLATTASYSGILTAADRQPLKDTVTTWTDPSPLHYPPHSQSWGFIYQFPPTSAFPEPTESYPTFNTEEWPGITTGQSPCSLTSPAWEQLWMDSERASIKTSSTSSPRLAVISAVPPVVIPFNVVNPDDSIQDRDLGITITNERQKTYWDAYWRWFHPMFPFLHRQSVLDYGKKTGRRGLLAAIMAIGAQYSSEILAGTDSRILHERCEESVQNVRIDSPLFHEVSLTFQQQKSTVCKSLETMQFIVLVEFLSQFKAKRAPDNLSEAFIVVYDQVCHPETSLWGESQTNMDLALAETFSALK
jgi:Fungal specific transcription factor domain